jgi:hypothetical protein
MAKPKHATSVPTWPLPDPVKHPLLALKAVLCVYLPLGGPHWLRPPHGFRPLLHVFFFQAYFLSEGYASTDLCVILLGFLLMMNQRAAVSKPIAGGWAHPNRFSKADLEQRPADREVLRRLSTFALFERLHDELRLLLRLLRAAMLAYRLNQEGTQWEACHRAAVVVLLRLAQISAVLRGRGSRSLAQECLRAQARVVWAELFGGKVPVPGAVYKRMQAVQEVKPWGWWKLKRHLAEERAAGHPLPPPVEDFEATWQERLCR